MTTPTARPTGGIRAVAAPESIGVVVAVVISLAVVFGGGLPGTAGAGASSSATPAPATASPAASTSGIATATRNALLAALAVNQRLAGHGESLAAAVARNDETGADIAATLRTMNQDVAAGVQAADRIAADPATATLGTDLGTVYREIIRRDEETLSISVQDGPAYRTAAEGLLTVLAGLSALDDRIADALAGRPAASEAASPAPPGSPGASPTATALPSATAGPSSAPPTTTPSLVANGGFDTGLTGWTLEVATDATAQVVHDPAAGPDGSGAARIDITVASGARAGIALVSSPFQLERGGRYRVTAMLRATVAREVRLRVATIDGRTTTARTFAIGPDWTGPVFEMTDLVAGSTSVFALDVGRGEGPVWVDSVSIVALGG